MTAYSNSPQWKKDTFQHKDVTLPVASLRLGPAGEDVPLVLFLHGSGERGADNEAQLKHGMNELVRWCEQNEQDCFILAPQCPKDFWWGEVEHFRSPEKLRFAEEQPILDALLALVEKTAREGKVDRSRIYLTGLSMGAYGSFALLERAPEAWAAAIPICGGGNLRKVDTFKAIPIHLVHGDDDKVVPVELSREMYRALKEADAPHVYYSEMLMTGHDSWTMTYRNPRYWEWLFKQKK